MTRGGEEIGAWNRALGRQRRRLVRAPAIGIIAGLGTTAFCETLRRATDLLLGLIGGYHIPSAAGEGRAAGSAGFLRPWAIPLVLTLGGLLAGSLAFGVAPEAEGHGTDAAIFAVHHAPGAIRVRAIVVKIVASALTIGSGGSGGREGPTAQISAGFGSLVRRWLALSDADGRIAVLVGIGSGIGAILSAPLGGAVLAADVLCREGFECSALLPALLAALIAYAILGACLAAACSLRSRAATASLPTSCSGLP
ncbi:MAG TPA: chloride channel protein [Solirubrobacteraceae bacterium]|nr:chloride channel protein [Solirubrobacteraceae bacterium]